MASALHQAPPPSNQVSRSTLLHCPPFLLVSRHSVVCRLEHGTRRPRSQQRVHAFSLRLRRGALFRHSLRGGGRRSSSMIYAATFGERPVLLRVVAKAARQHTSRDQRACTSFSNVFSVLIFQSVYVRGTRFGTMRRNSFLHTPREGPYARLTAPLMEHPCPCGSWGSLRGTTTRVGHVLVCRVNYRAFLIC